MALVSRRIRGRAPTGDYWPGFVDAMSSLLLVLIFLLTIFMITQFFLSQLDLLCRFFWKPVSIESKIKIKNN